MAVARGGSAVVARESRPAAGDAADRRSARSGGQRGRASGRQGRRRRRTASIDRAQLEMRLAAGQIIETTDRFRQFQPVAQTHIKICDLLARAHTLDELDAMAAGEIARSEIVSILTLFFERSFLVFKRTSAVRGAKVNG